MAEQGDLFESAARRLARRYDDGTYPLAFWEWLEDNQHVLTAFIRIARKTQAAGFTQWSGRAILHILRWETAVREGAQNALKINNNASPGLVRLAMQLQPELTGFFRTRSPPHTKHGRRLIDGELYGADAQDDPRLPWEE